MIKKKKVLRQKTDKKFRGRVIMGIRKLIFSLSEIKFINTGGIKRMLD